MTSFLTNRCLLASIKLVMLIILIRVLTGATAPAARLCPSDDRDSTAEENRTKFLLTNTVPQAPQLNRQSWLRLEEYCRGLVAQGNELYIIAGTWDKGGEVDNGKVTTIAGDKLLSLLCSGR
ncbi:DNA/RNA non-specific endonuclease [Spirosoma areae]